MMISIASAVLSNKKWIIITRNSEWCHVHHLYVNKTWTFDTLGM